MDQCSENLGEAWVVYEAVRVACSSCVSVGVCAFVCACVYVYASVCVSKCVFVCLVVTVCRCRVIAFVFLVSVKLRCGSI